MKKKIRNISLIGWILSLIIFVVLLVWMNKVTDRLPLYQTLSGIWLGDILFGIIAFLALIISLANSGSHIDVQTKKSKIEKHSLHYQSINPWFAVCIFLLAIYAYQAGKTGSVFLNQKEVITPTPTPYIFVIPTPTPVETAARTYTNTNPTNPSIDCVGPDGKHFQTTQVDCDNFNNAWKKPEDQIVNCQIQPECGGQTFQITKKECNTKICCEVNGHWSLYPDKSSCDRAQASYANSGSTVKDLSAYFNCISNADRLKNNYISSFCVGSASMDTYYNCVNAANGQYASSYSMCDTLK